MDEFNKLSQIKTYTKSKLETDKTGHGYDHIKRVVTTAEKILESEAADKLVTLAAAYLHDTIDDKLVSKICFGRTSRISSIFRIYFSTN